MTDKRQFIYVCSPLRGDTEANIKRAKVYSRKIFESGFCPIAPPIYFPQFLQDDILQEREAGMQMGISLLSNCSAIVICGNELTNGMRLELEEALKHRLPVYSIHAFLDAAEQHAQSEKRNKKHSKGGPEL